MGRKHAAARPPNRWTGGFASMLFSALPLAAAAVELRVAGIEVPGVERILHLAETFAEALVMDDLPLPEIADGLQNIRVVHQAEDVVIGGAGLLLCCDGVRTTFQSA